MNFKLTILGLIILTLISNTTNAQNELNVDFIKSKPLNKEEVKALSEFIKKLKNKK